MGAHPAIDADRSVRAAAGDPRAAHRRDRSRACATLASSCSRPSIIVSGSRSTRAARGRGVTGGSRSSCRATRRHGRWSCATEAMPMTRWRRPSTSLALKVQAGARLTVTPRVATRGQTVRLRGRLVGRPLPVGGKVVELQARSPGQAWLTFRTVRTTRRGRFANVVHLPAQRSCSVRDARPGEGNGRLSLRDRLLARRPRPRPLSARYRSPPMNRVLVTGGAGTIGAAVVRRLLRDPDFEVRVSDQRQAPDWMREGCEVHTGDLRVLDEAREATRGCTPRDPPGGHRRRDRELPQAAPHPDRGQQRALQRRRARGSRPRRRALHLRLELDGLRARDRVPDDRGAHRRHADPALGLRVLQADRRGLRARRA